GDALRVLGIAGSLRAGSYNRSLLEAAVELAPEGMVIETFDRLGEIPPYDADVETEGDPDAVAALKQAIDGSDALLWVTPEYNYSVPGVLKNAFDWASRPARSSVLIGRPAAVTGVSGGGSGTARAQMALRQSMVFTRTPVMPGPELLVSRGGERFDDDGVLTDEGIRDRLVDFLERFDEFARRFRDA
ncbi:MAG: NADPH-dependent FMN reductase, partial [Longimicrobiales bacterium]|nr:NADPH-dependent FMN reductase [Longimicrobiales bacterium]